MELQWIAIAFVFGFIARRLGQPPLVGYLVAGLFLEIIGFRMDTTLADLSSVGIKLLLFAIGLKLDLRAIARPEVWGVATLHIAASTLVMGGVVLGLSALAVPLFAGLGLGAAAIIGFALAFSSTVFVVKLLEERDDVSALYGRIAVGVLIVQDLVAVLFLAVSEGKAPSPFALGLGLLIFARPIMHRFLAWCGHGELLILGGFALTLGGSSLFEAVSMKGDLGALCFGVLAGAHAKSEELAKSLAAFKDIFLVGFFLSVGLAGLPTVGVAVVGFALVLVAVAKAALFHMLFLRFRLRARTSLFASLGLANFSEFALIVGAVAAEKGWLPSEWVLVFAMALVLSLVVAGPVNAGAYRIYGRFRTWLYRFERPDRLPDEMPIQVGEARALVFGLGRVGTAVYDELHVSLGPAVVGFDIDDHLVERHLKAGRRVYRASATDADAFNQIHIESDAVELVVLAMSAQLENLNAVKLLKENFCHGRIAVIARWEDEEPALRTAGADLVVQVMEEAGAGFARDALRLLPLAPAQT